MLLGFVLVIAAGVAAVWFAPISSGQVEDAIERIQSRVRAQVPEVITTFIKPPNPAPVRTEGVLAEAKQG